MLRGRGLRISGRSLSKWKREEWFGEGEGVEKEPYSGGR